MGRLRRVVVFGWRGDLGGAAAWISAKAARTSGGSPGNVMSNFGGLNRLRPDLCRAKGTGRRHSTSSTGSPSGWDRWPTTRNRPPSSSNSVPIGRSSLIVVLQGEGRHGAAGGERPAETLAGARGQPARKGGHRAGGGRSCPYVRVGRRRCPRTAGRRHPSLGSGDGQFIPTTALEFWEIRKIVKGRVAKRLQDRRRYVN